MASSCERASEAGVFARALDEVPASPRAATPSPRLPPSLPSVLLSSEEGKWQWPVKYVNFSSFPPPVALNHKTWPLLLHTSLLACHPRYGLGCILQTLFNLLLLISAPYVAREPTACMHLPCQEQGRGRASKTRKMLHHTSPTPLS